MGKKENLSLILKEGPPKSSHSDISTKTGKMVIVFTLEDNLES